MLNINTTDNVQRVFVPLPAPAPDVTAMRLLLINTTDRSTVSMTVTEWVVEGFMVRLTIQLPESGFYPGEWEYILAATAEGVERVTGTGLVDAREKESKAPVQYEKNVTYKQYGE